MKGYKGFNKGLKCLNKQYAENTVAKGKKGSWITLSEWKWINNEYIPVCVKTEQIDGERIKEDTFYKLENGEFKEVK